MINEYAGVLYTCEDGIINSSHMHIVKAREIHTKFYRLTLFYKPTIIIGLRLRFNTCIRMHALKAT